MSTEPRFIYEYAAALFPSAARLVPVYLSPSERNVCGGRCFVEAPYLIGLLGQAMVAQPGLFLRLPFTGQELLEQQERARAWRYLRSHLAVLLQIASDGHLFEQDRAISMMQMLIDQVQAEKAVPFRDDAQQFDRDLALVSFFCECRRRQARIRRRVEKNKKRRRVQAARRARR